MDADWKEWLNLALRWFHILAAIMWIGQTYLFNWMERVMTPPEDPAKKNISGELWMVHGGGFYLVEKQKWPEIMPRTLHWFKWESFMTWFSGVLLMTLVYWHGAPLMEYGSSFGQIQGSALSVGLLVLGWVVYVALFRSPLGKIEPLAIALGWALTVGLAYGLQGILSDRAVFLQIGAVYGTIMVANVWMIIIPSQKKMLAITAAGGAPQPELAYRAKRASKHNTYMGVPVLMTMISNHFPVVFAHDHAWAVLGALILVGWGAAKLIRDHL